MDDLRALWLRLNRPAPEAFRKELRRRGIAARAEDVRDFYKHQSSKQLFAPGPKWKGRVFSKGLDDKWFADIAVVDGKHYLVAKDEFSRYAWAEPIASPMRAYEGMETILERAGHPPSDLVTDADPGFRSASFQKLLQGRGVHWVQKEGRQDLAIVDRLIGVIKRSLAEEEAEGGDATVSDVIEGHNERLAPAIHAAPEDLRGPKGEVGDKVLTFDRTWEEGKAIQDISRAQLARGHRLTQAGAFRVFQPPKGPKRRHNEPVWSRDMHRVERIEGPYVLDDAGERHLTKEVLPVHHESWTVEAPRLKLNDRARALLQRYADRGRAYLLSRPERKASSSAFQAALSEVGNLKEALRLAGIASDAALRGLARVFPDVFELQTPARGGAAFMVLKSA
jgi:hypothetical protein